MTSTKTRDIFWTNRFYVSHKEKPILQLVNAEDKFAFLSPYTVVGQAVFAAIAEAGIVEVDTEKPFPAEFEIVIAGEWKFDKPVFDYTERFWQAELTPTHDQSLL